MSEQGLDDAGIGAAFQEVSGEAMAERMSGDPGMDLGGALQEAEAELRTALDPWQNARAVADLDERLISSF